MCRAQGGDPTKEGSKPWVPGDTTDRVPEQPLGDGMKIAMIPQGGVNPIGSTFVLGLGNRP